MQLVINKRTEPQQPGPLLPEPVDAPHLPSAAEFFGEGTGISLAGLLYCVDLFSIDEDATTSDVCHAHIKPATVPAGWRNDSELLLTDDAGNDISARCWYKHTYVDKATGVRQSAPPPGTQSMCAALAADPATAQYIGKPSVFLSHAWLYKTVNVVEGLKGLEATRSEDEPERFFWFDCFSIDEHATQSLPQEWWGTTFKEAIEMMGHTIMLLSPWNAPQPLTRAWCLWELYCTVECGSEFSVCLGPAEEQAVEEVLAERDGCNVVLQAFSSIDVAKSEAGDPRDLEMILANARTVRGGLTGLNVLAVSELRQAVSAMALRAVERKLEHAQTYADTHVAGLLTTDAGIVARQESVRRLLEMKATVAALMKEFGNSAAAETILRENLSAFLGMLGQDHLMTLTTLSNLGLVLQNQDELDEAAAMFETAYHGFCRTYGENHVRTMRQMSTLAMAWNDQGKIQEAASLMQHAFEQLQTVQSDPSDPEYEELVLSTTATVGNNLGNLLMRHGNLSQAATVIEQAHQTAVTLRGERHPETLTTLMSVALLRQSMGRRTEALDIYKDVCAGREVTLGAEHPDTCTVRNNMATLYAECGQTEEAVTLHRTVLDIRVRTLGERHRDTLSSRHSLGILKSRQDDQHSAQEAETLLRQVSNEREEVLGPAHPDTLGSLCDLGSVLVRTGSVEEGEHLLRTAYRQSEGTLGPQHPDTQLSAQHLGFLLQDQGNSLAHDPELALGKLVEATALLRVGFPVDHPEHARALSCEQMAAGCRAYLEGQRVLSEPEPERLGRIQLEQALATTATEQERIDSRADELLHAQMVGHAHPHLLARVQGATHGWACDTCRSIDPQGARFRCEAGCDYDICERCMSLYGEPEPEPEPEPEQEVAAAVDPKVVEVPGGSKELAANMILESVPPQAEAAPDPEPEPPQTEGTDEMGEMDEELRLVIALSMQSDDAAEPGRPEPEPEPEPQSKPELESSAGGDGAVEATFVAAEPLGFSLTFADPTNRYNVPCDVSDGRPVHAHISSIEPGSQAAVHHPQLKPGLLLTHAMGASTNGLNLDAIDALMMQAARARPSTFVFAKPTGAGKPSLPADDPVEATIELETFCAMTGLDLPAAQLVVAQAGGNVQLAAEMFFESVQMLQLRSMFGSLDHVNGDISESVPPRLRMGLRVTVMSDVAEVQKLQTDEHGGWEFDMPDYCGRSGEICHVFGDGDVKVLFDNGRRCTYNGAALVVSGQESEPETTAETAPKYSGPVKTDGTPDKRSKEWRAFDAKNIRGAPSTQRGVNATTLVSAVTALDSDESALRLGVAVTVGLKGAPQHNGKHATVRSEMDASSGRHIVETEDGTKLKVKPANFREEVTSPSTLSPGPHERRHIIHSTGDTNRVEPEPEPEPAMDGVDTLPSAAEFCGEGTGLSLAGIEHCIARFGHSITDETTTSDLCHAHIKPATVPPGWVDEPELILFDDEGNDISSRCWYKHVYRRLGAKETQSTPPAGTQSMCAALAADPKTACFVGKPSHFLSHAWLYKILNVAGALAEFEASQPEGSLQAFFWYDCFAIDEHATQALSQEWWSTTFKEAIKEMGHTVMMLSPWDAPQPLTRAWCLWELFCTEITGSEFSICLGKDEEAAFTAALLEDAGSILAALSKIDVEKAQAGSESDRLMIVTAAAAAPGGLRGLDGVAMARMRQWIISKLRQMIVAQTAPDGSLIASAEPLRIVLAASVGLHALAEDAEALPTQEAVVVACTKLHGRDAKKTLWAMNSQAITLNSLSRLPEARALYEEIVQVETTPDSTGVQRAARNNLIEVLERMCDVNEALRLAQLHCADLEQSRGAAHIDTLQAQNNLAGLLGKVGGLSAIVEARRLMELVVAGRSEQLGQRHTETLSAQQNLAILLKVLGKTQVSDGTELAEAERLLILVIESNLAQLGARHGSTLVAQANQADVLRALGKREEARAMYATVAANSELHHPWYADATDQAARSDTRTFTLG